MSDQGLHRTSGGRPVLGDPMLLGMILLSVAMVPWFTFGPHGPAWSWAVQTGIDVLDAIFAYRLFRLAAGNRHSRRFWLTVTIATTLCAIGDLYQTILVMIGPADQPVSVIQTAFVVAGMLAVVVVMLFHPLGGAGRQRLRLWLDTATVLTGVAGFLWYFSLAGVLTTGDRTQRWSAAAVSAVMLLVVFAVIKLVLSGTAPFTRGAAILGGIGVAGTAVGASVTSLLTGSSDPRLLTIAQLLPCLLVAVSFRLQEVQLRRRTGVAATTRRRRNSRVPYVAVIATQILLVAGLFEGGADLRLRGVAVAVVLSTALVVGRQLAALTDNERLVTQLDESMVQMRALHDELHHQATHDTLTGLANRALLEQRLREAPPAERVSMLLIDLDGFKPVNDRHGHQAGDQVLVAVARRLDGLVGGAGLVARLGGDEFAVLLPAGGPSAAELAARVSAAVAEPIPVPGGPVAVGASVGMAAGLPNEADRILREADVAMYRTKASRKASAA
ncbi:MAG: GGDEF domain-containing protein [Actinoplanes sp.]